MNGRPTVPEDVDEHSAALLRAAVVIALALLIVLATFWSITDLIPIFLSIFLPMAAWLALVGVTLVAFVFALRHRHHGAKQWLPFGVCIAAAAVGVCFPFTDLWLSINYRLHRAARARVVSALEQGQLPTPRALDSAMVVHLPWARSTSGGGDILVERENGRLVVLFFTYRGILSRYSGYMYRSDSSPVPREEFSSRVQQSKSVEPHWFFTAF